MENKYLETAIFAAKESAKIQLSYIGKEKNIGYKGKINLVTEVDRKSEENVIRILSKKYPSHQIIAEETKPDSKRAEFTWYIDPLDGTTNFSHNYPIFAVSIALEINKEMAIGVVLDPTRNELFHAVSGKGAYLNGERLSVSNIKLLQRSLLASGFPYIITERSIKLFNHMLTKAQAVRRAGAAAIDLCYLASGRVDGFFELDLKPWDMAAGKLIVKEAGGIITDFKGAEHSIFGDNTLASNGLIHEAMIEEIETGENK